MKYKLLLVFGILLITCGCTNRKCVKTHKEKSRCIQYSYIYTGNTTIMIPHYYECIKTICDEYEESVKK